MTKNLTTLLTENKRIADELAKARIKLTELENSEKLDELEEARRNVKELEEALEKGEEALKEELSDITMREKTKQYYSVYRELTNEINQWIAQTRDQFIAQYLKDKYEIDYADVNMKRPDWKKTDRISQLQETLQEGFERIREAQPKIHEAKKNANRRLLAIVKGEVMRIASRHARYTIITDEDKNRLALEAEQNVKDYQNKLVKQENNSESEELVADYSLREEIPDKI